MELSVLSCHQIAYNSRPEQYLQEIFEIHLRLIQPRSMLRACSESAVSRLLVLLSTCAGVGPTTAYPGCRRDLANFTLARLWCAKLATMYPGCHGNYCATEWPGGSPGYTPVGSTPTYFNNSQLFDAKDRSNGPTPALQFPPKQLRAFRVRL